MRFAAAGSSTVRALLVGPERPARLLGTAAAAVYLATDGRPGVVAVLTHDAVRLPCGVVLPSTRAELPLTAIGPAAGGRCVVGDGRVSWDGPDGPVVIDVVREWAPARIQPGIPTPAAVAEARLALPRNVCVELPTLWCRQLHTEAGEDPVPAVRGLLGSGPGLTPSGDDLLAGFLLGCLAFGRDVSSLRSAIAALAPRQTTALSAALLAHALRGQCIPEVAALTRVLTGTGAIGPALDALLRVGHTSGAALARGLLLAAGPAVRAA
jgi:Protein of unknown function (DUF2877)